MRARLALASALLFALPLGVRCAGAPESAPKAPTLEARIRAATGAIDDARLRDADADVGNWLTHGRTYAEQRYSPLAEIDVDNVAQLGLLWSYPPARPVSRPSLEGLTC